MNADLEIDEKEGMLQSQHCAGSNTCTLRCCKNNMDEDEIIKRKSPHSLENFLFFFSGNSHLLLSYVIFNFARDYHNYPAAL